MLPAHGQIRCTQCVRVCDQTTNMKTSPFGKNRDFVSTGLRSADVAHHDTGVAKPLQVREPKVLNFELLDLLDKMLS